MVLPFDPTDHQLVVLDAALGELLTTCAKLEYLIDHGEAALKPESRKSSNLMFYKSSKVYYDPLGVVSAIVSWNYRKDNSFPDILYLTRFSIP